MRVVPDSPLGRAEHARVLNAIRRKDVDVPLVASNRDRHHYGTLRIAEPLGDRLVHFRVRDRLLELRQRSSEEGRIPFEPGFLRRKLFDLGHGRSLGFPSPCGGLLQLYDLLVEVTRNPAPT